MVAWAVADGGVGRRRSLLQDDGADLSMLIVQQFGRPDGAGEEHGVRRHILRLDRLAGELPQQAIGQVIEVEQTLP